VLGMSTSIIGLHSQGFPAVEWSVVIGLCLVAAMQDARWGRIPNWLTGPGVLTGLVWAAWKAGLTGFAEAAAACAVLMLPFILLFTFAGGGAGDAKLMAAVGAWLGLGNGLIALAGVSLMGIVLGLAFSARNKGLRQTVAHVGWLGMGMILSATGHGERAREVRPERRQLQPMRYGVAIFVGCCLGALGSYLWRG